MAMDTEGLGKKIKAYRAKCGWSQKECAERIGISTKYLADIERGEKIPKTETLIRILNILNASADDVLQDSLTVGYIAQSNCILEKLDTLDVEQKKLALDILDSVISLLKAN